MLFLFSKTAVSGLLKPWTEFYSTWIFDLNDDSRACWTALGLNLTILVSSLSEVVNTSIWYIRDSSKRKIINILGQNSNSNAEVTLVRRQGDF
jgi:hypothetical protein